MKSETKIIIVESIIIIFFLGLFILGSFNQCEANSRYERVLEDNRKLNTELSKLNTDYEQGNKQLEKIKSEFAEYYKSTEETINKLSENFNQAREIIGRFENERNKIQTTTNSVSEATAGIRKILTEIMDN